MAQRRMFSKHILDSDAFMDMPMTSQLLYMHLAIRADDDGFVDSPKKIIRMIGSQDDDYKILIAKRFVIPFESGICVIKHWLIHNYIQKDRYSETVYIDEKNTLEIKDNGVYTQCIHDVSSLDSQVRLGKDSIGKVSIVESKSTYGEFNNVKLKEEEYQKLVMNFGEKNTGLLIEELSGYIASKGKKYSNHYATLLNWARRKIQEKTKDASKYQVTKIY